MHGVTGAELLAQASDSSAGPAVVGGIHPVLDASLADEVAQASNCSGAPSALATRAAACSAPSQFPASSGGTVAQADAPPPPFVDPALTEDDVAAAWLGDVPDYGGALSQQEARELASLLTAPFLRAPLALAFFAQRPGILVQPALRAVLSAALFEPLECDRAGAEGGGDARPLAAASTAVPRSAPDSLESALGPLATIPVQPESRTALGHPFSALAAELVHAPGPVVHPLIALLRAVLLRCREAASRDDGRAQHTAVLLWAVRTAARVEGILAGVVTCESSAAAVPGVPGPAAGLSELQSLLRGPVLEHIANCIGAAEATADVPVAAALHAHIVVIWGASATVDAAADRATLWGDTVAFPGTAAVTAPLDLRSVAASGFAHVLCSMSYVALWSRAARMQAAAEANDEAARQSSRGGDGRPSQRSPFMARSPLPPAYTSAACDILCNAPWSDAAAAAMRLRAGLLSWLRRLGARPLAFDADADWRGPPPRPLSPILLGVTALAAATKRPHRPATAALAARSALDGALSLCVCVSLRSPRLELRAYEELGQEAFRSCAAPSGYRADDLSYTVALGVGVLVNGLFPLQLPPSVSMHPDYRDAVLGVASDGARDGDGGAEIAATAASSVDAAWLCTTLSAHEQRTVLQVQRAGAVYDLSLWMPLCATAPDATRGGKSLSFPFWEAATSAPAPTGPAASQIAQTVARLASSAGEALVAARSKSSCPSARALRYESRRYSRLYIPGSGILGAAGAVFDDALRDAAIGELPTTDSSTGQVLGPFPRASTVERACFAPFVFLPDDIAAGETQRVTLLLWLQPPTVPETSRSGGVAPPPLLGTFYEAWLRTDSFLPPLVEVFQIVDVGRAAQRCLVFSSDTRRSVRVLESTLQPRRSALPVALARCGGRFLGASTETAGGAAGVPASVAKRVILDATLADSDCGVRSEVGISPRLESAAGVAHIPVELAGIGGGGAPISLADAHRARLECPSLTISCTVKVGALQTPHRPPAPAPPLTHPPPAAVPLLRHLSSELGGDRACEFREAFVPPRAVLGLLPEALLLQYELWLRRPAIDTAAGPTGAVEIVGYPRQRPSAALDSTITPCSFLRNSRGFAEHELLRVRISAEGTATVTLGDAPGRLPPPFASSSAVGAAALMLAGRTSGPGGSPPEVLVDAHQTLLCPGAAPGGSPLGRLQNVTATAEVAAHTLIWGRGVSVTSAVGGTSATVRAFVLERVDLPRLRQSFEVRVVPAGAGAAASVILASCENTGYALSDDRPAALAALAAGLPQSLVLEHTEEPGQLLLLTPCVALRRPVFLNQPFSTSVVPLIRADWAASVRSRMLAYPVHPSRVMLMYRSNTAALHHVACLLWTRRYDDAAAVLHTAALDSTPNDEQRWLIRQMLVSSDDRHPCALALRLRFLAALVNAAALLTERGGTLASHGLGRVAINALVLSPFALLGKGSGDPWGVAWRELRSWIEPPAGVMSPKMLGQLLGGVKERDDGKSPLPLLFCVSVCSLCCFFLGWLDVVSLSHAAVGDLLRLPQPPRSRLATVPSLARRGARRACCRGDHCCRKLHRDASRHARARRVAGPRTDERDTNGKYCPGKVTFSQRTHG